MAHDSGRGSTIGCSPAIAGPTLHPTTNSEATDVDMEKRLLMRDAMWATIVKSRRTCATIVKLQSTESQKQVSDKAYCTYDAYVSYFIAQFFLLLQEMRRQRRDDFGSGEVNGIEECNLDLRLAQQPWDRLLI
ncbi:AraC family transcriptional regulator [Striga asiatica]|uniref:AraC family transcriptional regulator n=1 Tax=Striga asiatica TaxID=4170 RepID=A0A5A7QD22_STRAF|nr:AraC family transcriptional regulator [Striga asiatica]